MDETIRVKTFDAAGFNDTDKCSTHFNSQAKFSILKICINKLIWEIKIYEIKM